MAPGRGVFQTLLQILNRSESHWLLNTISGAFRWTPEGFSTCQHSSDLEFMLRITLGSSLRNRHSSFDTSGDHGGYPGLRDRHTLRGFSLPCSLDSSTRGDVAIRTWHTICSACFDSLSQRQNCYLRAFYPKVRCYNTTCWCFFSLPNIRTGGSICEFLYLPVKQQKPPMAASVLKATKHDWFPPPPKYHLLFYSFFNHDPHSLEQKSDYGARAHFW